MTTSETQRPPEHPFYGDNYKRGMDPFHPRCFPEDIRGQIDQIYPGPQRAGWFLLDAYGNEIAFIPDGTQYAEKGPAR